MTVRECLGQEIWPYCAVVAWFVQMGFHEGMHAQFAYRRGDPTADFLGKRSVNPLAHIEWTNPASLIASVAIPILTVFAFGYPIPIGMAWVPINMSNFRQPLRDRAIVSAAGPFGNLIVCAICLVVHFGVLQWLPHENRSVAAVETLCCAIYATSIVYGVFNLVPIPPLDGSRIVYWLANAPVRRAYDTVEPYGFFIVLALFQLIPEFQQAFWGIVSLLLVLYR